MTHRIGEFKLTPQDRQIIAQAKLERKRLRQQFKELTDRKLAEKFGVHKSTIYLVKEEEA